MANQGDHVNDESVVVVGGMVDGKWKKGIWKWIWDAENKHFEWKPIGNLSLTPTSLAVTSIAFDDIDEYCHNLSGL